MSTNEYSLSTENREVTGSTPVGATRIIITVIPEALA